MIGGTKNVKISVAMATYNGAIFLRQQIESLKNQSVLPDELVVYDDCSSDDTLNLIEEIASEVPFKMTILCGTKNVGVNKAFQTAVEACRGEYVFFCDQDDIWLPEKIETCLVALEASPAAGYAFSNATLVNANGVDLGTTLWQMAKFTPARQRAFRRDPVETMLIRGNFIYGMGLAFRIAVLKEFLPIHAVPAGMTHDTWFALHASAIGANGIALPERLIQYRQHNNQTTAGERDLARTPSTTQARKVFEQTDALIASLVYVKENLAGRRATGAEPANNAIGKLERKIVFLKNRQSLRSSKSVRLALFSLLQPGYWKYARGPLSVIKDYLAP